MPIPFRSALRHALLGALALGVTQARGDDEPSLREPLPDAYRQECGACHVPYPPRLLPAPSWQRILRDLAHHFETDASLEPAVTEKLSAWLTAASGARRDAAPPPEDRITRSRWFVNEHDDVGAAVFQRPSIGSAANCAACHTGADQGDFDEDDIRIPR